MEEWILIFVLAAAYSLFAAWVNRKFGERKRLKAMQDEMKKFQKEYNEARKSNNQAKIKELEAKDKELMKMTKDMMLLPFKSMIIILPTFLIVIWLIEPLFPKFTIMLPVGLHLNEIFALKILSPSMYGVRGFFIVAAAVVGLVLEGVWSAIEKSQEKKKKAAAQTPAPQQPKPQEQPKQQPQPAPAQQPKPNQ